MIKVGIIGTHGTGKTGVCHRLVSMLIEKSVNAEHLGEIARKAKQKGFVLNENTTPNSQRWILYNQITEEIEVEELRPDVEVLITDRASIDNYLYFVRRFDYDRVLDYVVNEHVRTYDLLMKLPLNPAYLKGDGIRATNDGFQSEMDGLIRSELIRRQVPYHEFTGIDSAVEMILKMLEASNRNDTKPSAIR